MQLPVQVVLQQTPLTQCPFVHSWSAAQVVPSIFLAAQVIVAVAQ